MDNVKKWRMPFFITFLILGLMLSVQFRTQQIYLSDLSMQKTDDLVLMLKKLHDKQGELETELADLQRQQNSISQSTNAGSALSDSLRQESLKQEIELGLTPVKGDGITLVINNDSPIVYLDLIDLTNELWASQTEAISINDLRITPWTSIFWSKQNLALTLNGQELSFPITIKAIGNPEKLASGLHLLGGVLDNLAIYKVYPVISKSNSLNLPAGIQPSVKYMVAKVKE